MNTIDQKQIVLIVDDMPSNLKVLGTALKDDYHLKLTTNGEEALLIAASKNPPDIILLDIMMPDMDGYEVCRRLKEAPETKDIPVVFITAMNEEKDEEYGLMLGAIDYVTKPFSIPIVKARIKNHLELKRYRDMLKANSMIDGLTQIANRRRFDEALLMEWNRQKRHSEPLSMLMIDIDFFKNYNDTYGHLEGDECLKQVAETIKGELKRPTDLAARWGGEEFACILPETDPVEAMGIAENIRKAIMDKALPHRASLVNHVVTVSVGVAAMLPSENTDSKELIKKADDALYEAKQKGRNQVYLEIK
ncbi:MAG: domain S-box/diguanylate cyclase protein [Clostridia bacterium]|jgi:diguanylate cyclase (GGDEF)-like protein|nr:domain S-box/diguanylate cyclase protein [Clostridia bacterium]